MRGRGALAVAWCARRIAIIALCAAGGLASAAPVPGVEQVRFRNYSTADGLPQATARAIAQDVAGFLWVGTQDGLARFDGYGFTVYAHDRRDPWSLSDGHVSAVVADPDGSLWIGTVSGGLDRYDPDLDRFKAWRAEPGNPAALASNSVSALLLARDGRLWVAGSGGRLQWFDRAREAFVDSGLGERVPLRQVRRLLELRDGTLLAGTLDGLWRIDPASGRMHEIQPAAGVVLDVQALVEGPDGSLWAGTAEDGLYRFDRDGTLRTHYRHAENGDPATVLHDDAVRALLFDRAGTLWIAGNARGLASLDLASGHFARHRHDPARQDTLAADRLCSLFEDQHGLLVVGSWINGISIHDPRTRVFTQIENVPGDARALPSQSAMAVQGDADGTLWIGVTEGGGLVHLDPARGVVERFTHDPLRPDSLAHDFIQYVTRTRDGSLWVATGGGGLDRMRPGARVFEHLRHDPADPGSLASDSPLHVYEDRAGTLWVASSDRGLDARCAGCSGFRHYRHDPADAASLADNAVEAVLETSDGDFWIATHLGLDRLDRASGRFEHFRTRADNPSSISSDMVTSLAEDSHGQLWVATQGGGVNRALRAADGTVRFEAIDRTGGLAADAVGAVVEDARGRLWASTTVGISRIDPDDGSVLNFGAHDGAQGLGYWVNAATRLPDGRIAFGGLAGVTLFDPLAVVPPPQPEPVVTGLLLSNVPVALRWLDPASPLQTSLWRGHAVELAHDQRNVTFEFTSLALSDPQGTQYAYRLDGHDHDWIETGPDRRLATYTDLPAGDYTLAVRARAGGGAWSEPASVSVRVNPAPWLSPGAYALYALVLLGIAALVGWRMRADFARQRSARRAIRLSEERLKLALWGSGSELWDIDLTTGRMHRENQLSHLAATHEIEEQSFAGYRPFVHPEDLPRLEELLAEHVKGRTPVFEASYRTPDREHEWVWILTRGRVVQRDASGRALRMSGTNSDINALRQALDALRSLNEQLESRVEQRTAALQEANRELRSTLERLTLAQRQLFEAEKLASLGGMVAGIAHEINTPLGIGVTAASHLRGEAQRLSQQIEAGALDDASLQAFRRTASESSELILRNLQRADRLIRSFKQVAVDQSSEDRRVVDLGASLDEILTALGPTLKKTLHRVELECPPGLVIETAPGALHQIVTNLVMNSLVHGFEDGSAGSIRIVVSRSGNDVLVDYADDGRGMDAAVSARVFEPFFTTRRGQGGSGLGLHITYSLVTQVLGGSITCESAPGAGTRFHIRLPAGSVQMRA